MSVHAAVDTAMVVRLRTVRVAVAAVFFLTGFAFATWAARVPAIQHALALSPGALSLALMGLNTGAVLAPPFVGGLVARWGSRIVLAAGLGVYLTALPLLALAPTLPLLGAALALFAVGNTAIDVAMNTQGILVERSYGRPILGGLHAMFSLGGLAGGAASSVAATTGVGLVPHFTAVAVLLGVVGAVAASALLPDRPGVKRPAPLSLPGRRLLLAGLICFCAMMGEGVMNDWLAVYLHDVISASAGTAAAGFAVFSLGMVVGRLAGDRIRDRIGAVRFLQDCGLLATAGAVCTLVASHPGLSLVGCVLLGLGLAATVPIVFNWAAN